MEATCIQLRIASAATLYQSSIFFASQVCREHDQDGSCKVWCRVLAKIYLTASSALPQRTFFCSALFSRLAGPVYSQGLPAVPDVHSRLLMSRRPPCLGSMLVHSFSVTCTQGLSWPEHRMLPAEGCC